MKQNAKEINSCTHYDYSVSGKVELKDQNDKSIIYTYVCHLCGHTWTEKIKF